MRCVKIPLIIPDRGDGRKKRPRLDWDRKGKRATVARLRRGPEVLSRSLDYRMDKKNDFEGDEP
jgi:hypothetical protein